MDLGLTTRRAPRSVPDTVQALRDALSRRGIELFAVIDHAAGAASVGLDLEPETVLIFGNPAVGTGLMQADPRVGIELPLRILVWSAQGRTHIAFEDPHALAERFDLPGDSPALDAMASLLAALADEVSAG
ncbi:DUF302 domain-containing protein [Amnibacterium sp.]|uniref:DUF302 domain-containing protein n=1 Tax=Amnibacterium sp. TaxID=1872496 RepID=UPI003F7C6403